MDQMTIMLIVWLTIFVIAIIIELSTTALVSFWLAIGALVTIPLVFIPNMSWWLEAIVCSVITMVSFFTLRPIVNRSLMRKKSATNVDSLIGKKVTLLKDVSEMENGEVKVNGLIWTACLIPNSQPIKAGKVVEIVSVEGNKLYIK